MSETDRYSREFMVGHGVVHRDKAIAKRSFQLLALIPCGFFTLVALFGFIMALTIRSNADTFAGGIGGAAATFLAIGFAFMWATISVVRSVVTRDELHVQVGVWGPHIPLDDIIDIKVAPARRNLRVGKRLEGERWVTSYIVSRTEHVELSYVDDEGETHHLRFSASDPAGLVSAVERGRDERIAESQRYSSFDAFDASAAAEAAEAEADAERDEEPERHAQF